MTTTHPTPAPAPVDPTAVMGRRVAAWVIDSLLTLVIVGAVLGALGEYKDVAEDYDDKSEFCDDLLDANSAFDGTCIPSPVDDRVYLFENSDSLIYSGATVGWFLFDLVLLQGIVGGSVGKLLTGVRVVDTSGRRAGIGRCLGRSVMWIVDGLPCVPAVGAIAALTSNGHRRVGDMVAGTFVVRRSAVGHPVAAPAAPVPPGAAPWGAAPPQAWPSGPVGPPPPDPAQRVDAAPPVEPIHEPAASEPLGTGAEPAPEAAIAAAAEFDPSPTDAEPPTPEGAADHPSDHATAASTPATAPQWDAARGTYIQWDANAGVWLQWDAASSTWTILS